MNQRSTDLLLPAWEGQPYSIKRHGVSLTHCDSKPIFHADRHGEVFKQVWARPTPDVDGELAALVPLASPPANPYDYQRCRNDRHDR